MKAANDGMRPTVNRCLKFVVVRLDRGKLTIQLPHFPVHKLWHKPWLELDTRPEYACYSMQICYNTPMSVCDWRALSLSVAFSLVNSRHRATSFLPVRVTLRSVNEGDAWSRFLRRDLKQRVWCGCTMKFTYRWRRRHCRPWAAATAAGDTWVLPRSPSRHPAGSVQGLSEMIKHVHGSCTFESDSLFDVSNAASYYFHENDLQTFIPYMREACSVDASKSSFLSFLLCRWCSNWFKNEESLQ